MTPTLGRTVLYRLNEQDADTINKRRADARAHAAMFPANAGNSGTIGATGHVAHVGNDVRAGQQFPAVVVATWTAELVNLHVLLDGSDTLWACSVKEGDGERQWSWPPRV